MEYSGKQRAKRPVAFLLMLLAALILSGVTVMAGEEEISSQGAPGYNDYIYTTLDYEIVDTDYLVVDEEEGFVYPYRNKYVLTWYLNDQGELTLTSIIGEDVTGEFRIPAAVQFQRSEEYDPSNIFDTFVEEGTSYPVTAINNLDHGKFSTLVIPDSVKTIASCAYCDNLTKLTLPGGVEIKETQCFEGCPALEEVTLGSGIKHIPNQTFRDCKALKKVTLPDTLESIGDQVFSNDISLTTINENNVLPASLKSIGEDTFARCALTQITMPANYDADHFSNPFGGDHYLNCQTLEEIKVAEGGNTTYFAVDGVLYYKDDNNVTRLAAYPAGKKDETFTVSANTIVCRSAFSDNTYLKEVTFEDGVVLEPWAFTSRETAEAKGLAIGGNVYAYEEGFDNVIPLKKIVFKGGATIEYNCFENCESLTDIVFESDKLIDFANNSFVQCDALTTFTYPRNFTLSSTPYDEPDTGFMGRRLGLFDACQNLATVKVYEDTNLTNGTSTINPRSFTLCNKFTKFEVIDVDGFTPEAGKGCYADETGVLYDSAQTVLVAWPTGLETESYTIPATVTTVREFAFYSVKGPKKLMTGDTGEDLDFEARAFYGLALKGSAESSSYPQTVSSIEEITLGKRVKSIGASCFSLLQEVKKIDASGSSLTYIPSGAFDRCYSLEEVDLPEAVETIAGASGNNVGAFNYCKNLKKVNIPTSMDAIAYRTFMYCSGLEQIVIPAGVTSIADDAFFACDLLASVRIEGTNVSIMSTDNPFYGVGSTSRLKECKFFVQKGSTVETWLKNFIENDNGQYNWKIRYIGEFTITFYNEYVMNPDTGYSGAVVLEKSVTGESAVLKDVLPGGVFPQAEQVGRLTFLGWFASEYGSADDVAAQLSDVVTEDTTYYARYQYIPQDHTLTLYSDGKVVKTLMVSDSTNLSEVLPTLTKDGYTFKGWSRDADAKVPDQQFGYFDEDSNLYAVWEAISQGGGQNQQGGDQNQQGGGQSQQGGDQNQQGGGQSQQGGDQNQQGGGQSQQTPTTQTEPKVGDTAKEDGATYTVTETDDGQKGAEFTKAEDTTQKTVTVPATIEVGGQQVPVVSIADNAFSGDKKMQSVTLPSTIVEIGDNAFKGCTALKKVDIPKDTQEIGTGAFSGCSALTTVNFKGKNVKKIGKNAFAKCKKLKKTTLPDSVTEIGKGAFDGDAKLGNLTLNGNNLKKVGKNALRGIKKNAKVTIKAKNKTQFNKVVKMIKNAGNKKLKFTFKKAKK